MELGLKTFIICLMLLSPLMASGIETNVETTIEKTVQNEWILIYRTDAPIDMLAFKSSPDKSRTFRWRPLDDSFVVTVLDNKEIIRKSDSTKFTQVSLYLTPTYIPLPKDYAPFSPFYDGSMLIHSGRFFACPNTCTGYHNSWEITLISNDTDLIIVDGKSFKGRSSWVDKDEGQKVYVGSALPIENENIFAFIDNKLPSVLFKVLQLQIPEMMVYFSEKLGKLKFKPTLFASYSDDNSGSYGNQGGTLPNQVFMHWYGKKAIADLNEFQVSWFFAHEIAHVFQGEAKNISAIEQQWIHEGGAEYMAYELLSSLGGKYRNYAKEKFSTDTKNCHKNTSEQSFGALIQQKKYDALYECGLVFWKIIATDELALENKVSIFDIWTNFNLQVDDGNSATFDTFINTLKPFVTENTYNTIHEFLEYRATENKHSSKE